MSETQKSSLEKILLKEAAKLTSQTGTPLTDYRDSIKDLVQNGINTLPAELAQNVERQRILHAQGAKIDFSLNLFKNNPAPSPLWVKKVFGFVMFIVTLYYGVIAAEHKAGLDLIPDLWEAKLNVIVGLIAGIFYKIQANMGWKLEEPTGNN